MEKRFKRKHQQSHTTIFPKNCDFTTIAAQQIKRAMDKLNNRPRKSLGFKTLHMQS